MEFFRFRYEKVNIFCHIHFMLRGKYVTFPYISGAATGSLGSRVWRISFSYTDYVLWRNVINVKFLARHKQLLEVWWSDLKGTQKVFREL